MKRTQRLLSFLIAMMLMCTSVITTVFAADTSTYKAFQIFKGTQAEGSTSLAVTGWGDGVDGDKLLAALKASTAFGSPNPFKDSTTARDVAGKMTGWADGSDNAKAFAKLAYQNIKGEGSATGETLDAGYYLVVDKTEGTDGGTNTVKNLALTQLTNKGTFDITSKVSIPVVQKKVKDIVDTDGQGSLTGWQDSADWDIGDDVPFQLKATIGNEISNFPEYGIIFHDTECEGLTPDIDSIKVYVGEESTTAIGTDKYSVTTDTSEGEAFQVIIPKLSAISAGAGSVIRVEYTAELNSKANLGEAGNPGKVKLEYSNNPNWIPGTDSENKEGKETGFTPEDKVIVFTYKIIADKVDNNGNALTGAEFALYKFYQQEGGTDKLGTGASEVSGTWTLVAKDTATLDPNFAWIGIDDGTYKLVETTIPSGYIGMEDKIFKVTASHDISSDDPKLTALSGEKVTGEITFTGSNPLGVLSTTIANMTGTTLPETGGIGTTIFYVVGAVLLGGAAILLITRKRMEKKG